MDFKLELLLLPVADVDRAKAFYTGKAGFNLDVDVEPAPGFRIVQMTPPGSACSVTLDGRGVKVSEITHFEKGERVPGVDPAHSDYGSFADFADPDGNTWVLQEVGNSPG
jgi:catechol 2,3-dioxygenase-like lactoylglutathione lyase family enzyme